MTFLKFCVNYLEKEKVNAIQEIKKNIIALECDITKIYQNLKSVGWEICYLSNAMAESSKSSSSEKFDSDYAFFTHIYLKKKSIKLKKDNWIIESDKLSSNG